MSGKRATLGLVFGFLYLVLRTGIASGQDEATQGEWGPLTSWPNVAIHTHVLPTGRVLFWGRREWNATAPAEGLDPEPPDCTPRIWDPQTGEFSVTPSPGYNLFCAGHSFLPDGRLFVVGGHIRDSVGDDKASIYDPVANTWTRAAKTNRGRWYPTQILLADGGVLVISGSFAGGGQDGVNKQQQVWKDGLWRGSGEHNEIPLYPRMHLAPDGRVFLAGHLVTTQLLDTNKTEDYWEVVANSAGPQREDGCSVLYDEGKVLIIGGGIVGSGDDRGPLNTAQVIDLNDTNAKWTGVDPMHFKRRHHNATLLPDGTVLVTGGTRGATFTGGTNGFNDVSPGKPVHTPEIWDPNDGPGGSWTKMADEQVDRCYHATAVLLPDARVLSAGGGEWRPFVGARRNEPNDNNDSRRDAQIFSPPYLFKSTAERPRPVIASAPKCVAHGETFEIESAQANQIAHVNWIRLSSVTHQCNFNQRINFLSFTKNGETTLDVTAPATPETCPPGHYMLFILNDDKVPSVARIVRIP